MTYQNRWTFQGFTTKSYDTSVPGTTIGLGPLPDSFDPFPTQDVINALTTVMLSNIQQKLISELAKAGITVLTVSKIEPFAEVIRSKDVNLFYGFPPSPSTIFHHVVNMSSTVYFETDKPAIASPIAPIVIAALVTIIEYLILVAAAALVIYAIAETFIKSFFTQTQTVETYDTSTGTWTKETITTPSLTGQITGVIVALAFLAVGGYFVLQYFGKGKGRRK